MIALDTPTKFDKSSKSSAHTPVAKLKEDIEDLENSDVEKAEMDSSNDDNESHSDKEANSGAEGDDSNTDEEFDESNVSADKSKANPGWADAMKKILNTKKPKKKKSIVLSKAKKLNEITPKVQEVIVPFEIEDKGVVKKETIEIGEQNKELVEQKKHRKKDSLGIRSKPSVLDRDRERRLQKIATNGVVQLFNAVRQQQKEIEEKLVEAGPLERKREKALKNIDRKSFLDVLMGGTNKLTVENEKEEIKQDVGSNDEKKEKVWSVLRDEFVMGAKLKDWNKQDTDEDSSAPEVMDDSD